jgi:hypothetical protein
MIQQRVTQANLRIGNLFAQKEAKLEVAKRAGMKKLQLSRDRLNTYLRHLEHIYDRIADEANPLSYATLNASPNSLATIHGAIDHLGETTCNVLSGELGLELDVQVRDLDKLGDLRGRTHRELSKLLENTNDFDSVALGFIGICPMELTVEMDTVNQARSFSDVYAKYGFWKRQLYRSENRDALGILMPKRIVSLHYSLTPLGRTAVLDISRETVMLAERERLFDQD